MNSIKQFKSFVGSKEQLEHLEQGIKVGMLGRQNERNSSYVRLAHTSIFGLFLCQSV